MAKPQDDYDQNEAMMNIINAGTQYGPNMADNNVTDFDDDSQYLINFDDVQESVGQVYLLIILHI